MSKNPEKDFGPIADDYVFFEKHATEAAADVRGYLDELGEIVPAAGTVRMLDFGCGSGTFTVRFLDAVGWPPERLRLTLVEPVAAARREAVGRLAGYASGRLVESATLTAGLAASFDFILANHVFYYVPDLAGQLVKLIGALASTGVFVTAVAARTNKLIEFWIAGFRLLDRDVPYNTSEDVEAALVELGAEFQKRQVPYELTFPDTEENRLRIIRFLLADHLSQMPLEPLLSMFDQYSHAGRIQIRTESDHFMVRAMNRG
jgi:trans-aconitate 2-methyltransferase